MDVSDGPMVPTPTGGADRAHRSERVVDARLLEGEHGVAERDDNLVRVGHPGLHSGTRGRVVGTNAQRLQIQAQPGDAVHDAGPQRAR